MMDAKNKYNYFFNSENVEVNLKEKSVRGGIITTSTEAIVNILRFGSIAILARILIPEHFGLIGMVTAVTAIAERFKDFGLGTATIQQKDISHEQVSKLFWINLIIGMVLTIGFSLLSFPIAYFYDDTRLIWITIAISSSFAFSGLTIQHQAILRRNLRFVELGLIQIISTLLSLIIAVGMAVKGFGYWALVWREVSRNVFIMAGTWIYCPWKPCLSTKNTKVSHLMKFGGDITGFNLINFFVRNLDQILIGKLFGAVELGFYRQGYQLVLLPIMQFIFPVNYVAEPTLSILQREPLRYQKYYINITKILNMVSMPVVLFLVIYSKEIVLIILGDQWLRAADIFRFLAIAAFIKPAIGTTGFVMISCGQTRKYLILGVVNSILLTCAICIGLLRGALGVAFGHVIYTYLWLLPQLYFSFKDTPVCIKDFFDAIRVPVLASAVMFITLMTMKAFVSFQNSYLTVLTSLPVALASYLIIWLITEDNRNYLKKIINDIIISVFKRNAYFIAKN